MVKVWNKDPKVFSPFTIYLSQDKQMTKQKIKLTGMVKAAG
jgi:hypothetical protein